MCSWDVYKKRIFRQVYLKTGKLKCRIKLYIKIVSQIIDYMKSSLKMVARISILSLQAIELTLQNSVSSHTPALWNLDFSLITRQKLFFMMNFYRQILTVNFPLLRNTHLFCNIRHPVTPDHSLVSWTSYSFLSLLLIMMTNLGCQTDWLERHTLSVSWGHGAVTLGTIASPWAFHALYSSSWPPWSK